MRRTFVIVVLGIATALAGAAPAQAKPAQPCGLFKPCFPPDFAPPLGESYNGSTYELTLNADRVRPRAGQQVTFAGFITQDGGPVPGGAGGFELVASPFPYSSEEVVASTGPTADSSFTFTHVPRSNTRYYVRTGDLDPGDASFAMTSATLQVRVFARVLRFDVAVPADEVVSMKLAVDFPDGFLPRLNGRKVRWYITRGKGSAKRLTKVAVSTGTSRGSARVLKAKVVAALPPGRYSFRATFCVATALDTDVGVGDPQSKPCP